MSQQSTQALISLEGCIIHALISDSERKYPFTSHYKSLMPDAIGYAPILYPRSLALSSVGDQIKISAMRKFS